MPKLIVIEGKMKGQTFDFEGETIFIGRSSKNDIQVKDSTISRKQLKIFRIGKKYFVEDLKSTNGTYINGEMIAPGEGFDVEEGDTISIGNTLIRLEEFPARRVIERKDLKTQESKVDLNEKDRLQKERRSLSPKNLELIYKVSELLKQSLSINELVEKVLEYLLDALPRIDTASIILFDSQKDKKGQIREVISRSRQEKEKRDKLYSRTVVDRVIQDGKAIRMSNTTYEKPDDFPESKSTIEIGSVLCVPMISNSEMRGAIYVDSLQAPYGFRKDDMLLLNSLSGSVAVAIEKAMLSSNSDG